MALRLTLCARHMIRSHSIHNARINHNPWACRAPQATGNVSTQFSSTLTNFSTTVWQVFPQQTPWSIPRRRKDRTRTNRTQPESSWELDSNSRGASIRVDGARIIWLWLSRWKLSTPREQQIFNTVDPFLCFSRIFYSNTILVNHSSPSSRLLETAPIFLLWYHFSTHSLSNNDHSLTETNHIERQVLNNQLSSSAAHTRSFSPRCRYG